MIFLILLLFSLNAGAAGSAITVNMDEVNVGDSTFTSQNTVVTEVKSGTSSAPHLVYMPLAVDTITTQTDNTLYTTTLPTVVAGTAAADILVNGPYVRFRVTNNQSSGQEIYLAVKNDDGYKPIKISNTQGAIPSDFHFAIGANSTVDVFVRLNELCENGRDTCDTDVEELATTSDNISFTQMIYLFPSNSTFDQDSSIDTASAENDGVFLELHVSSEIPQDLSVGNNFNYVSLKRGDTQLIANYTGASSVDVGEGSAYKILIISSDTAIAANDDFATHHVADENDYTLKDFADSGQIAIPGLTNGTNYFVSLGVVNKYKFVSHLTESKSGTPLEIEKFLQTSACYFISAGFQTDHYVLHYLRNFRDQTLVKTFFGKMFIKWYYRTAPQYTHYIYNSPVLSAVMRGVGYSSYFILKYWQILMSILGCLVGIRLFQKFFPDQRRNNLPENK